MPFGLTNSPAAFRMLSDRLIGPKMEPPCFAYLDDIIIVTETFEDHSEWLAFGVVDMDRGPVSCF